MNPEHAPPAAERPSTVSSSSESDATTCRPPRRISPPAPDDVGGPGLALALADGTGGEPEPVGGAEREARDVELDLAVEHVEDPDGLDAERVGKLTSKENLEDAPRLRFLRLASVSPSVPITEIPNSCPFLSREIGTVSTPMRSGVLGMKNPSLPLSPIPDTTSDRAAERCVSPPSERVVDLSVVRAEFP